MASATYGRLFTEEDVRVLLLTAYERGRDECSFIDLPASENERGAALLAEALANDFAPTFNADEPVFVLRASDPVAPDALSDGPICYEDECQDAGYPDAYREAVREIARDMRDWQCQHPDRVRPPEPEDVCP